MPLQKQYHNIDMISGIDQRTDGKGLNSSFLELENGVYRKANRYEKRNGFDRLAMVDENDDVIDPISVLDRNKSPVVYGTIRDATDNSSEPGIFVRNRESDKFERRANTAVASIEKSSFFGYTNIEYVDFEEDSTSSLGLAIAQYRAYTKSTSHIVKRDLVLYDYEKNKIIKTIESDDLEALFTATEWSGLSISKVLNGNNVFYVFFAGNSGSSYFYGFTVNKTTFALSSKIDIDTTAGYEYRSLDCVYHTDEDKAVMSATLDDAGSFKLFTYSLNESSTIQKVEITDATHEYQVASVHTDGSYLAVVGALNNATPNTYAGVKLSRLNPTTFAVLNTEIVDSIAGVGFDAPDSTEIYFSITSTVTDDGLNESVFVQSYDNNTSKIRVRSYKRNRNAGDTVNFTRYSFLDRLDTLTSTRWDWHSTYISTKSFSYDGNGYVCVVVQDDTILAISGSQYFINTTFLVNDKAESIASFERYESQVFTDGSSEPAIALPTISVNGNKRIIPSQKWTKLSDDVFTATSFDPFSRGVERVVCEFDYVGNFQGIQNRNDLYIAGGQLLQYDGDSIVEHGFFHEPYNITSAAGGGGSIPLGDYSYALIYKWVDAGGRSHFSKPRYFSVSGLGGSVVYTSRPPCFTRKEQYTLNLYRLVSGNYILVDESVSMQVEDIYTDAQLEGNPILYAEGGVIENFVAPSSKNVAIWNNRLWLTGCEVGTAYWYSKIIKENTPVEFALEFSNVIESDNLSIIGGDALGDSFVMMKTQKLYYLYGDGPNDVGYGSFSEPKLINTDTGLINPKSIKNFPLGVIYQGNNGFHAILENRQIIFLGHRVEDYGLEEVTGIGINNRYNELVISTVNRILVYNYKYDRWSYFIIDSIHGLNGVIINEDYEIEGVYSVNGVGEFRSQSTGYQDNGVNYECGLKTGWISLMGVSGFQRIYRLLLTGDYIDTSTLDMRAEYDYDTTVFDDYQHAMSSPEFTASQGFTIRNHLSKQKCKAVRFDISFTSGNNAGLNINNLVMELGVKSGAVKNGNIITEV